MRSRRMVAAVDGLFWDGKNRLCGEHVESKQTIGGTHPILTSATSDLKHGIGSPASTVRLIRKKNLFTEGVYGAQGTNGNG